MDVLVAKTSISPKCAKTSIRMQKTRGGARVRARARNGFHEQTSIPDTKTSITQKHPFQLQWMFFRFQWIFVIRFQMDPFAQWIVLRNGFLCAMDLFAHECKWMFSCTMDVLATTQWMCLHSQWILLHAQNSTTKHGHEISHSMCMYMEGWCCCPGDRGADSSRFEICVEHGQGGGKNHNAFRKFKFFKEFYFFIKKNFLKKIPKNVVFRRCFFMTPGFRVFNSIFTFVSSSFKKFKYFCKFSYFFKFFHTVSLPVQYRYMHGIAS